MTISSDGAQRISPELLIDFPQVGDLWLGIYLFLLLGVLLWGSFWRKIGSLRN